MNDTVSPKIYGIIENVIDNDIKKYSITFHDPNKKGQGFMGQMVYVSLKDNSTGEVLEFVIKQAFEDEEIRSLQPIRDYYVNEINFYNKVWPQLQQFQRGILREPFDKVPKCFGTSSDYKNEKLVLENLKFQNFETYSRTETLTKQHIQYIFTQYARFHATSFAYKALHPEEYLEISGQLNEMWCRFSEAEGCEKIINHIHEFGLENLPAEEYSEVIEKYERYVEDGVKIFQDSNIYKGNYSAILHGDCWSNNMMFKYNESGNVTDIRLLDFQFAKEGTPVSDLSYCLYSSASKEILDKLDDYLKVYHDTLSKTLTEFGCIPDDVYPLQQLKSDWKQYSKMGFTMALFMWRLKLIDQNHVVDFTDRVKNKKNMLDGDYDEETFRIRSRDLILHMYENDFL